MCESCKEKANVKADPHPHVAAAPKAAGGAAKKGPPVFELQGDKKWIIENQDNNKDLVITECSISQGLYIYKCDNCVIKVDQKINAITLDSCKKTALVFDSAVSSCEIVGCQSVQVQVLKGVPIINIDKTDGVQVCESPDNYKRAFFMLWACPSSRIFLRFCIAPLMKICSAFKPISVCVIGSLLGLPPAGSRWGH